MQDFGCEETTSNQIGASPCLPMFPNRIDHTPNFAPLIGGHLYSPNATPPPTATNVYAGWTTPSVLLAGPSYSMNSEILQHHKDASFENAVSRGHLSVTQDLFNVFSFGAQEQIMPMDNNVEGFDSMPVFHGKLVQSIDDQFNFCSFPIQSASLGLPLREQFHGELDPAPNLIGNLNPQSLLDSDIPIPCHQFGCFATFKRDSDRIRHEAAVHGINKATYLCHVVGCNKGQGVGYTRKDKLTEHLWKKHRDLGYVKRT